MIVKFKLRRDTAARWSSANPVLADGEPGWDSTNKSFKVGDGVTAWNSLALQSYDPVLLASLVADAQQAAVEADEARDEAVSIASVGTASTTAQGLIELATNAEATTGTDTVRAITPASLAAVLAGASFTVPPASTTVSGSVELATNTEAVAGTDAVRAVTPAALAAALVAYVPGAPPSASTTVQGVVELATNTEATTGTSTTLAVTPSGLAASVAAESATAVKLTGNQTIAGTKTFSSAIAVPDASIPQVKVVGLSTALTDPITAARVPLTGQLSVISQVTTGFWPTSYAADGTPVYTGGSQSTGVRPTSRAVKCDWVQVVSGGNFPPSVVSGTAGMLRGFDFKYKVT